MSSVVGERANPKGLSGTGLPEMRQFDLDSIIDFNLPLF